MPPLIGAKIQLGGVERTLRFTAPALVKVQSQLGGTPLGDTMGFVARASMRHITVLLWGGLLHETPELKLEDAEALVEPPIKDLVSAIVSALDPWLARGPVVGEDAEKKSSTPS